MDKNGKKSKERINLLVFEAKKHCHTALHRSDRLVQVFRPRGERGQKCAGIFLT